VRPIVSRARLKLANLTVLFLSLVIGLVLSEVGARLVLNPADYLTAPIIRDDILGIKIAPGAKGFDDWGFRNPDVPSTVDVVAIGDSHTYGNNAAMAESWPYVVARLTGRSVYNLGLGGYGPNQYYYLLRTRGLSLRPRWVVCGLYMGDDFENAFLITYGKDYWVALREEDWKTADADIWEGPGAPLWHHRMRAWLSRNSVLYRIVVHGPVFGNLKGALQIERAARRADSSVTTLIVPDADIQEAFRPGRLLQRLDQRSDVVREGMRLTFKLLEMMHAECLASGCRLVVVLIPTKETVFADYLLESSRIHLRDVIAELIDQEGVARKRVVEFLDQRGISHIDALPALRRKSAHRLYTRSDGDMHPNRNGYRVIGEAVAEFFAKSGNAFEDGQRARTDDR
jgi:hypothetical protein